MLNLKKVGFFFNPHKKCSEIGGTCNTRLNLILYLTKYKKPFHYFRTSSSTVSSRCFSTSASTASRSIASEHPNKGEKDKAHKHSPPKSITNENRDKIQRRKTKSCPSCTLSSKATSTDEKSQGDKTDIPRTASIFGKYNGKDSEYKPTAWFNLPQETSVGVIDSFACDAKNTTPLCYSINVKKGESVPNLLRHNLEVRVGQNGVVRTKQNREKVRELGDENAKQGKKRTAPLNWEEQLNWQNVSIALFKHSHLLSQVLSTEYLFLFW